MWEGRTIDDAPISDEEIQKRIKSYQKQDKQAGRDVCELSIENVRNLLLPIKCFRCNEPITRGNWTLYRKDNSKGHSYDNLQLCCRECKMKKKDKEQRIFTWDLETHPESPSNGHTVYSANFTEYALDVLSEKGVNNIQNGLRESTAFDREEGEEKEEEPRSTNQ